MATSALYQVLCKLLGADVKLIRLQSKDGFLFKVNNCKWFGYQGIFDDKMSFTMHQVGCHGNSNEYIYDPVFYFQSGGYVNGLNERDYINTLVVPKDRNRVEWLRTFEHHGPHGGAWIDNIYDVTEYD